MKDEDLRMLDYFWSEKGNLERWSEWEDKLPFFQEEYPELVKAWNDYKIAGEILNIIVKQIVEGP